MPLVVDATISMTAGGRIRPAGVSAGTLAFVGAWLAGAAIARLTGAAAVLLVLAAGLVALGAAALSSMLSLRSIRKITVDIGRTIDVGTDTNVVVRLDQLPDLGGMSVRLLHGDHLLGACSRKEFDDRGRADVPLTFPTAGVVTQVDVEIAVSGAPGLFWMRRTSAIQVDDIEVAPVPSGPRLDVEVTSSGDAGTRTAPNGTADGDVDGVRPWREGEGDNSVHWTSTLRSGTLIVRDRTSNSTEVWALDLPDDGVDEVAAARFLFTALEGLRLGHRVTVSTSSGHEELNDAAAARSLAARAIGPARSVQSTPSAWYQRSLRFRTQYTSSHPLDPVSRIATALISFVAIGMLFGALGSSIAMLAFVSFGLALGVVISMKFSADDGATTTKPWWLRAVVGAATTGALAYVASTVGGVSGLLAALRGPMPDLLVLLLVVHGLEVVDHRTQRVNQAIASVVVAYAAGLRVDGRVGLWLAAWALVTVVAVRTSTRSTTPNRTTTPGRHSKLGGSRPLARRAGTFVAGALAVLALLSVVPVPEGPARLGLPALSNDAPSPSTPGALAGPSGEAPTPSTERRGSLGQVGGYPGFSETLDTSVRGDLGDDLVMRVRASEPAFWRGQTFTDFNGRTWTISDDDGVRRDGPQVDVPATLGDLPRRNTGIPIEEFVQTYFIESDLPNVVFAASRPDVVTFDGSVWTRPDGSMRSNVTLTEGSVYTVVSQRLQVTPDLLQRQGDVAPVFAAITGPDQRALIEPYLALPDSTTQRTIDLATSLRQPGDSTYQLILRYQQWLGENTAYDLNAPIPAVGADAVDDYLFESQRGFCEQIASSLAIMLRSQGIPTRIATGYIPGERNRVSGVFEVRASDAHAWVEVWFPETGWEAFDPTAQVPLSGEAQPGTVGGDLISAAVSGIVSRPVEVGLMVGLGLILLGTVRTVARMVDRRRRGRWGVLQDRFSELTDMPVTTNPARAESFDDPAERHAAHDLAEILDRVAFDPAWVDDDDVYERARERVDSLL